MTFLRKGEITAFLILICSLSWNCREKPVPQEEILKKTIVEYTNPKVIVDLCTSAGIPIADTTDIKPLLRFQMIDSSGALQDINIDEAARLFRRIKSGKKIDEIPLMEFKSTGKTLMMLNGRGYGEPIRATLILNNKTQQIELVQLDQGAQSGGYGSGITTGSFEDQFIGVQIEEGITPFGLKMGTHMSIKGKHQIEGISGATVSCQGAINMVNQGIEKFADALSAK